MNKDQTDIKLGDSARTANWLGVVVVGLMLLGVVMVYSASGQAQTEPDWGHFWKYASLRQVVFVPVAVLAMLVGAYCPVRWWRIGRYGVSLPRVMALIKMGEG